MRLTGELTEQFFSPNVSHGVCSFGGGKLAEMIFFTFKHYACAISTIFRINGDPLKTGLICFVEFLIGSVLRTRCQSQIGPLVVSWVTIPVIDFGVCPLTSHDQPNDALSAILTPVDLHTDPAIGSSKSSWFADFLRMIKITFLPRQDSGLRIVVKNASDIFRSQISASVFKSHLAILGEIRCLMEG